ncbi:iron-containing alcohol dehydrogenase [Flexithrix dorotheae]|uniref:iron-containing alcohol dehydrogenase n=1 Tax=Flexithrix dorotheae TaxID=70993 RepID=UPI00037C7979|nr:iron-containing alcohol dehydrogenase [Flexithrix dorotheae]
MDFSQRYSYSFPTNIRFGAGVIDELPAHLKNKKIRKPLVVTDGTVKELPFFKSIIVDLDKSGIQGVVFSEMQKNPVKTDVLNGGDVYHENKCDAIIGLGGGAPLDVARAIALRVNHTRDLFDYDDLLDGWKLVTNEVPYFVTIPTNAGTGSEVGRSTVISEDESHKKRVLFAPQLLASQVFADPLLTMDLPPFFTAATGMDALSHNVEAFLAKGFHPMADGIALEAISLIAESIEKATFSPDTESRSKMLIASLMGAVAFQKGLGIIHSLAHPLSTIVDAHHGTAISLMFGHGLEFNTPGNEAKMKRLAEALKIADPETSVSAHIMHLTQKLNLPQKISEIGVKSDHIAPLAQLASEDFCLPCNPNPATKEDFISIYQKAL